MGYWADLQKSVKEKDKREGVRRSDYINRDVVKKAAVTGAQESDQAKCQLESFICCVEGC